ncbi:MAG TPA: hypothetical protein VJW16_05965 [Lysobacter sp.]|nr:hypothetical protein [Lysobacter sp.]
MARRKAGTDVAFETVDVWRKVTPELQAELVEFWMRHRAIPDAERAKLRALQAVCIARNAQGELCGVATAMLRIIPRLRQPTYYFRQFFAPEMRGQQQARPFFHQACRILEEGNKQKPESLGILLEVENQGLNVHFTKAVAPNTGAVFIGYSPRGFQLRVIYFEGAALFPPAPLRRRRIAPARPAAPTAA